MLFAPGAQVNVQGLLASSLDMAPDRFMAGMLQLEGGGAGFGFYGILGSFDWRASLAWRTRSGAPTSVPASSAHTPTLRLRANVPF